jgi:anti-anti-sigma factor
MELNVRRHADAVVLQLQGRIDHFNAPAFAQALQPHVAACRSGGAPLVFDLAGLEYISSAGLRVFMLAAKQAAPAGGRIALAAPQPVVREIIEISRFDLVFPLHASVEEAVAQFAAGAR